MRVVRRFFEELEPPIIINFEISEAFPSVISYDKLNTIKNLTRLVNCVLEFTEEESSQLLITIDVKYRRAYSNLEFNLTSATNLKRV